MTKSNLRDVVVSQNHNTILPFIWTKETGINQDFDGTALPFVIQTTNINYNDVIIRSNNELTQTTAVNQSDIYVPQTDESYYKHNSKLYVDVITEHDYGMSDVRTHVEPQAYDFVEIKEAFNIPIFSWSNDIFSNANSIATTTTTTPIGFDSAFWCGTNDKKLVKVDFNTETSIERDTFDVAQYVNYILKSNDTNKIYVSLQNDLRIYSGDKFIDSYKNSQYFSLGNNTDNRLMVLYDTSCIWAVESYNGKIVKMNKDDLSDIAEYSGFDAPFKVLYSKYHNYYFVIGRHILWRFENGVKTNIYQIGDYWIEDAAISDNGELCLLFKNGTYNLIRILKNNLYDFCFDIKLNNTHNTKYCKYCNNQFIVLDELLIEGFDYIADNYIFDLNKLAYKTVRIQEAVSVTTTTTTQLPTTSAIQVESPDGAEYWTIGEIYDIKWASDRSSSDNVKIELYQNGYLYYVITSKTNNSGIYAWTIPTDIKEGTDYKIRITWLASTSASNYDESNSNFAIVPYVVTTTTTTTTEPYSQYSIGIDWDKDSNYLVVLLRSGLFAVIDLNDDSVYGLINSELGLISSFALSDNEIDIFGIQTKVRIFVGSEENYSDRWDSGIIETRNTSMLYGGGNNLIAGKKYYVNIQTYSEQAGWGEVAVKEFVMPKTK